jgi:hypothetical protein
MVNKETVSNKVKGSSLSGKELNPWLSRRLAKSKLMYASIPTMMTRQTALRLGDHHLLNLFKTPSIPLSRDTAFPGNKRVVTSPFWSAMGIFWLTRRRRLKRPLNSRPAAAEENIPDITYSPPDPVFRSNRQNVNQTRNATSGGEPEAKAAFNFGIIPQEPDARLTIKSTPVNAGQPQSNLYPRRQTPVTEYPGNPARHSAETEPAADQPEHSTGQSEQFIGKPLPANRHPKPIVELSTSESGRAEPVQANRQRVSATGGDDNVTWPFKHIHKHSKHSARQYEPSARQSKNTSRKLKVVTGKPVVSTRQSKSASGHSTCSAGQVVTPSQKVESLGEQSEAAALSLESAFRLTEPASGQIQPETGYDEPEVMHDSPARLHSSQCVTASRNHQPIDLLPVSKLFSGSNGPGESDDAGDGIPQEVRQEPEMLPLSSRPIEPLKGIIPANRPLTRQPGFQAPQVTVSEAEATDSLKTNPSSSISHPKTINLPTGSSSLGIEKPQLKITGQNKKPKSIGTISDTAPLKVDLHGKNTTSTAFKSNSPDMSKGTSVRDVSPSDLPQGRGFDSAAALTRQENQDISLLQPKVKQVKREIPVSQRSTGRNPALISSSPDSLVQPLDVFTPKTLKFVVGIDRTIQSKEDKQFQYSREDAPPAVRKAATSQVFKGNQNRSIGQGLRDNHATGLSKSISLNTTEAGKAEPLSGGPSVSVQETPVKPARMLNMFSPEKNRISSQPPSIPYSPGEWSGLENSLYPQPSLLSPVSRQAIPVNKTGQLEIPGRAAKDYSPYPVISKPSNLTPLSLFLATARQLRTYPDVASDSRPIRENHVRTPPHFQAEARPPTRRSSTPEHAAVAIQQEQENMRAANQNANKTDLKALAREVYPFIKRMIIVDRERLPL